MVKSKKIKKKSVYNGICDICGRSGFINGHALGGHKKYCGKSEFKKRKKKSNKNLSCINKSIKSYSKNFEVKENNCKDDLNNLLDDFLYENKDDLVELQTIYHYLNSVKKDLEKQIIKCEETPCHYFDL